MSFESLSHTPEFELPANAPSAPADLISLIEECYEGLAKVIVSKMQRRGKYEQIATIICQDNPTKKTTPTATADDIADYCMMCMQYEMEKTDDPGTYRVMLIGPPGRGRFERSKHVDLSEGDGMARSKTVMSEGELIEQQSNYIGELHSQSIAVLETLHGMVKPLLQENKEQMKIISESARRLAEVERDRMRFDLEMRMHADQVKIEQEKEEAKNKRWSETMSVVKDSGAVEGLMKAIVKKMNNSNNKEAKDSEPKTRVYTPNQSKDSDKSSRKGKKDSGAKKGLSESRVEKAKKTKKKSKKKNSGKSKISKETQDTIEKGEDLTVKEMEEVFEASALEKAQENPTALMVEILKMSIEEKDQWEMIEKTLTKDQFELFKKISNSESDDEIESLLKELYELKGAKRLMQLEDKLDEDQKGYVEKLIEIATR